MAKKNSMMNLVSATPTLAEPEEAETTIKTTPTQPTKRPIGRPRKSETGEKRKPFSMGVTPEEFEEIQQIAKNLDMTAHGVGLYFLRYALKAWRSGKIKTQTKEVVVLPE